MAPATNTVKAISNEVGNVFQIHTFICGDPPQYQNFSKRLCWINMSTQCTFKNQNEAQVFLYHYFWRNIVFRKCSMSFSFNLACYMSDKAAFVSSVYSRYRAQPSNVNVISPAGREWICIFNKYRPRSYHCISVRLIYEANIFCLL